MAVAIKATGIFLPAMPKILLTFWTFMMTISPGMVESAIINLAPCLKKKVSLLNLNVNQDLFNFFFSILQRSL